MTTTTAGSPTWKLAAANNEMVAGQASRSTTRPELSAQLAHSRQDPSLRVTSSISTRGALSLARLAKLRQGCGVRRSVGLEVQRGTSRRERSPRCRYRERRMAAYTAARKASS